MADQIYRAADQAGPNPSPGLDKAATAAKSVADQAISASREIKEKAIGRCFRLGGNHQGPGF